MSPNTLTIVTRTSVLAMWQAEFVRSQLLQHHPHLDIHIKGIKTMGDKRLDVSLQKIGGKGLFVKELETALLANEADIAVHSLKDMVAFLPAGLTIGCMLRRDNPLDAWISREKQHFTSLAAGSRVGTSSLRRALQLKQLRPDLDYVPLRGNVDSRLQKCHSGEFDAIVLAAAGLERLGLHAQITHLFDKETMLPAVAQGAMGIECRSDDARVLSIIASLEDLPTRTTVTAERAMNAALGGSCHVPIAGFAHIMAGELHLTGRVGSLKHNRFIEAKATGEIAHPEQLGLAVADALMAQGAQSMLDEAHDA